MLNGFDFALAHMPAVKDALGRLPISLFMNVADAPAEKDLLQATDLVLTLNKVATGVRIRRSQYYHPDGSDLSIRYECRGYKTEIHKLREGFGDYYFIGFSLNNRDQLRDYWLLDLHSMRRANVFSEETITASRWPISPNGDGTAGLYIPLRHLTTYTVARYRSEPMWKPPAGANQNVLDGFGIDVPF